MVVKGKHSGFIQISVQIPLRGMMLGESVNLSKPWFPLLLYEDNNSNPLKE